MAESVLSVRSEAGINQYEISKLAKMATDSKENGIGFTYSDLTQRLLPAIVIGAYPDSAINFEHASKVLADVMPTPPFGEQLSNEQN